MNMRVLSGSGLASRLIRSSGWTLLGYGVSQAIRLASNLILTRLLYPEAFGLMAIITVFLVGLTMLSDVGIGPSIQQSPRGDEPDFINTAWTIQVIRNGLLFLVCCIMGLVAARIYQNDQLKLMLPVAGLSLLIGGFNPTRIETANRHLTIGYVTILDLLSQFVSLIVMLLLAWWMESVWSLVIGSVVAAVVRLALMHSYLPGPSNHFRWDASSVSELIHFGKWIFLGSICGFLLGQGDKAILGVYLKLDKLGVYNVGYFLANFPSALATSLMGRIMIPIYRERPPGESPANFAKLQRLRFAMSACVIFGQLLLAFGGVWLVNTLYDVRFEAASSVLIAVACMNIPYLIGMTYDYAALARGDSKGLFQILLAKTATQTALFLLGAELAGLPGALIGLWLTHVLLYPLVVRLARKHKAWDPLHDLIFGLIGLTFSALALWVHRDSMGVLWQFFSSGN